MKKNLYRKWTASAMLKLSIKQREKLEKIYDRIIKVALSRMNSNSQNFGGQFVKNKNITLQQQEIKFPTNNGILRLYHQFPYFYKDLEEMMDQLSHISQNLLCNSVWIGPLQEVSEQKVKRKVDNKKVTVQGSQYAMKNHEKFNARLEISEEKLKKYTERCRNLGLIPIFDLVLNQVAVDAEPIFSLLGKQNFKSKPMWDDTVWFTYENKLFAEEVINKLWKPFINKYIVKYGFRGVRIDAVKIMARDSPEVLKTICDYIVECCKQVNASPVIFAELLDEHPLDYINDFSQKDFHFTHILNSIYYTSFSKMARTKNNWTNDGWHLKEIGLMSGNAIHHMDRNDKKEVQGLGGSIGYIGNHDKQGLYSSILSIINNDHSTSQDLLESAKEFIFGVAYISDAGYYLLAGDEYLAEIDFKNKPVVFNHCQPLQWNLICNSNKQLTSFIGTINYSLSKLTMTAVPYWVELGSLDAPEYNIGIAVRHVGGKLNNINYSEQIDELICVNFTDNKKMDFDEVKKLINSYINNNKEIKNLKNIHIIDVQNLWILDASFEEVEKWDWSKRKDVVELFSSLKLNNDNNNINILHN